MESYLHPEITAIRKLSLPNGLQELMSDISREVLRAQPAQLYVFIKNYLSAMLVTREHFTVATQLHDDICCCLSQFELNEELGKLELSDEDIAKTNEIIQDYFLNSSQVRECNLIQKISKALDLSADKVPELQKLIREAFVKHSTRKVHFQEDLFKCSSNDEISKAVENTLNIYKQSGPSEAEFNRMAAKIQAAYRGYGITRNLKHRQCNLPSPSEEKSMKRNDSIQSAGTYIKENEIEELYNPDGSDSCKASTPSYLEEESLLQEIDNIDTENFNDETRDILESNSDQGLKTKRNVSFNADEHELDNYDYQHKHSNEENPEEHEEIMETIEEELASNEDIVSIIEDCDSIYDVDDNDISDPEVFVE